MEGQWARICDRVWKHKGVSVLSTPDVCAADKDQLRFALDQLIGVEVHLVLTVDSFSHQLYGAWLAELRAGRSTGWEKYVRRVRRRCRREHRQAEAFWAGHGVDRHPGPLGLDAAPRAAARDRRRRGWPSSGRRTSTSPGCGADLAPVVPPYADPAGVAVLRKVNRQLERAGGRGRATC